MLSDEFRDPNLVLQLNCDLLGLSVPNAKIDLVESSFASIGYYNNDLESLCSVFRSIIKNHPFFDANKRTASLYLIGGLESIRYTVDQDKLADLTLEVAIHQYEVSEIAKKLKSIIIIK